LKGFRLSRHHGKAFAKGMPEFEQRHHSPPFSPGGDVKKLASLMFATGLLALVAACATSDSTTSPDIATEDPTGAWALQSFQLDDGSIIPVSDSSSYTLDLGTLDAERAHIRADCNVCNGGYEVSGSTIEFGAMACTLAACQPGSLERDYLFALGSTSTYQRSGETLKLTYDDGVLRFQAR